MKKFLVSALILISAIPVFARGKLYSEAVDVFEILDGLAQWRPDSETIFRDLFKQRFELSADDIALLNDYAELRKKYLPIKKAVGLESDEMLFTPAVPVDFFEAAFFSSQNVDQALKKLKKKLKGDDLVFVVKVLQHFKPKISQLVSESSLFKERGIALDKKLNKAGVYKISRDAQRFFGIQDKRRQKLQIFFSWWPAEKLPRYEIKGPYLLIKRNPIAHQKPVDSGEVLEHLVLALIKAQPQSQKQNLSKVFLSGCEIKGQLPQYLILERPLSLVWSHLKLRALAEKKKFDVSQNWSPNPWANVFARELYGLIAGRSGVKKSVSGRFITQSARLCQDLVDLHTLLNFQSKS